MHFIFSALCIALLIFLSIRVAKKDEKTIKKVFAAIWCATVVLEITKIVWETVSGKTVSFEWTGVLPLYPCSIFMYAMPLAIWGKGDVRRAGCGYVCTLGLLGGAINFVYPANILQNYSCISFSGFHTFFYHGAIVFCAVVMFISGYHRFTHVTKAYLLILPSLPFLCISLMANAVNFSHIDSDYMFFKLESFIFAPIGAATPDILAVVLVYAVYLLIHAAPYLPSFYSKSQKNHVTDVIFLCFLLRKDHFYGILTMDICI